MFARVITAQAGPRDFDSFVDIVREQLPGASQQPGCDLPGADAFAGPERHGANPWRRPPDRVASGIFPGGAGYRHPQTRPCAVPKLPHER